MNKVVWARYLPTMKRASRIFRQPTASRCSQAAHTPQDRGRKADRDRESSLGSDSPLSLRPRFENQWLLPWTQGSIHRVLNLPDDRKDSAEDCGFSPNSSQNGKSNCRDVHARHQANFRPVAPVTDSLGINPQRRSVRWRRHLRTLRAGLHTRAET